ncbi:MAG: META domain-containing protein [Saprospiraceae bacterium]|nr:META domain-containing protein [Saprospiraceae bacterium]
MKTIKVMLFSLLAVLLLPACQRAKTTAEALSGSTEFLYKYRWSLTELAGQPILATKPPYINFIQGDADRVAGYSGCNEFGGEVDLSNLNFIKFSGLNSTKMACIGENVEQDFLDIFSRVDAWSIAIDELSLFQGKDLLAKFKGLPPEPEKMEGENSALNGRWELKSLTGTKLTFEALFPGQKPNLAFNLPVMEVMGSTGCNSFTGAMAMDSNHIEFINLVATEKACNGIGEPTFINALKAVSTFSLVDSNTLALMKADTALLRFVRQ